MDGSVIENCCGAVALVSHFWIIAKPLKHKKAYNLAVIQHEIQELSFLNPVSGPSPQNWNPLQLGHTAYLCWTLPVPLPPPNLPENPRWDSWVKRSLSSGIPSLAGGQGLGWNGGAGWGEHCKSRGGNVVGFGPLAFVGVFCCYCCARLNTAFFLALQWACTRGGKMTKQTGF